MLTVAVLISGTGSNLRALLDAAADPDYRAEVVVVGADREADGFAHAEEYGIPSFMVPWAQFASREEWGAELSAQLAVWRPDLVVLSGLMRLLPASLVDEWSPRIINTHPAYLPEFPGAHGVRDALAAGVRQSGASVIIVDNGVDSGPILAQERVPVLPGDDQHTLHDRIKPVERRLLIDVVRRIASGELDLQAASASAVAPSTVAEGDVSASPAS
ncbi:phosphoribosylglycinamide formyltransferase [Microbacterium flavescens]|uniref:phosphoribosylglycinamide formyltransferase n=1 Tax=Microbacterium flavescens TaxID=69366 RepID=UPI001BDEA0A4|nr:phosphoribosylglycinamide formyltransferase [Microbacterium flavescens]BFF08878.1 phosphoribosylglycinamide formyltransferase [Microbacterium flavescens]